MRILRQPVQSHAASTVAIARGVIQACDSSSHKSRGPAPANATAGSANGRVQQAAQAASAVPDTAAAVFPTAEAGGGLVAQAQRVVVPMSHAAAEQEADEGLITV